MSIAWLLPGALIGLALIALPIAIHLLVRQHVRTLEYPSLRFLRETQLAAFRRRSIEDAVLLLCRAAIVGAAAIALAGPLLQTAARQSAYASRTSRAIVVAATLRDRAEIDKAAEGAFASTPIANFTIADALLDAVRWLNTQPASAREIVILGRPRRGDVTEADLSLVDRDIGIRFVMVGTDPPPPVIAPVLALRDGRLVRIDHGLRVDVDSTTVTAGTAVPVSDALVRIVAAPADTALAEAALRAALTAGVPWINVNQRVVIAWAGAPETSIAEGERVIRMPVPSPPSHAADAVRDALAKISPPRMRDPVAITAEQLKAWTRAPGPPSPDAPLADEGDRRWVWGAILVLLALEAWMRRSAPDATVQGDRVEEPRVA